MGAGQSLPSELTHEKLFELTKNTRSIMNILLEYMLKEITVRDFLALSNPSECKKYVIFKANTLYKYFYELQIAPTKDKKGVIAFRPVKELVSPQSDDAEKERQSLCLILAYYYTRIFQIYGALALTLIDDMEISSKIGFTDLYGETKQRLLAPGQRSYTTLGGAQIVYTQLQLFYFLRSFLLDYENAKMGFKTIYGGEGNSRAEIYFKRLSSSKYAEQDSRYYDTDDSGYHKGVFTIGYYGASKYATLDVFAKKEGIGSSNVKFTFDKLRYYKRGSSELKTATIPNEILTNKTLTIIAQIKSGSPSISYTIKDSDLSISEYFTDFFTKLVPFIRAISEGEETDITKYGFHGLASTSETGVEELRLSRIIQNLTKTKPYGHCIARALQLLRSAPFKDQPGISYICKAKFIETSHTTANGKKMTVSRSGIPIPGTSLETSPGLASLAQLFYDTIQQGSLKIGIEKTADGKSSLEQYILFMQNMAKLFGDDKDASGKSRDADSYLRLGLRGIINKRDRELCRTRSEEESNDILLSANDSRTIYKYVKELFKIQLEHAAKCGAIFKQLFHIESDKSSSRFKISLNENILKVGFPEIERINGIARQLLIDYYSKCETTYLYGMKSVLDLKQKEQSVDKTVKV